MGWLCFLWGHQAFENKQKSNNLEQRVGVGAHETPLCSEELLVS